MGQKQPHIPHPEMAKLPYLGFHTVTRMQPRQLVGIGARKSRELVIPRLPVDFDRYYERRVPRDPGVHREALDENTSLLRNCLDPTTRKQFRSRARGAADGQPTFLNRTLRITDIDGVNDSRTSIDSVAINWYDDRFEEEPLLWPLKLYAFEPLAWTVLGVDPREDGDVPKRLQSSLDDWIESWVETVEIGHRGYLRGAWTPWAVSIRILHWSRYLAWRNQGTGCESDDGVDRLLRRELYRNALFLRKHVEWDVGGNHLIENGAALVVAGVLFSERAWVDHGESILVHAANTQFLDDGAHFERSPMYHVLTLTRLLTVCDLLDRSSRTVPEVLSTTTEEATTFLQFLRPPDGRIPLLNDAVYGQALPLDCCLGYAETLGFDEGSDTDRGTTVESGTEGGTTFDSDTASGQTAEHTAGYQWLRTDAGAMLFDGGPVGPPHLPGHSHSDTLSFLLWLGGQPIVTDTGTFGYVSGSRRDYARGVRGHNTIQVGDIEPIALGGKYLMGPRPTPTVRRETGPVTLVEGRYDAAPYGGASYTHHRAVYAGDDWWLVWDTVDGHDRSAVRGRIHLHPEVEPSLTTEGTVRLQYDGSARTAFVYPLAGTRPGITTGPYFPQFGVAWDRDVLELHADTGETEPATVGFLATGQSVDRVRIEMESDSSVPSTLQTDDDVSRLPERRLLRPQPGW